MKESQRKKQKLQTKQHLIDVAMELLARDGLITTRTSDIAIAAKVSHGTLFAHFPTRELLLDEVIEEFGMRITRRLHELADNNCSIKQLFEAHLKGIMEYEEFYARLVSEGHLLNERARDSLIMIQSAISFHLAQVAEQEMEAGKIRMMPVDLLFNTWIALIHYYLINRDLFAPGRSVLEIQGDRLLEHFMNLIKLN